MKNFKLITIILGLVAFVPIMPKGGADDVETDSPSQIDDQALPGDNDGDNARTLALEDSSGNTKTGATNRSDLDVLQQNIGQSQSVESSASPESTVNVTSNTDTASGPSNAQAMDQMLNRGQAGAPLDGSGDGNVVSNRKAIFESSLNDFESRYKKQFADMAAMRHKVVNETLSSMIKLGRITSQDNLEDVLKEPQNLDLPESFKQKLRSQLNDQINNKESTNDTYDEVDGVGEGFDDKNMNAESPYIEVGDDEDGDDEDGDDDAIFGNSRLKRPADDVTSLYVTPYEGGLRRRGAVKRDSDGLGYTSNESVPDAFDPESKEFSQEGPDVNSGTSVDADGWPLEDGKGENNNDPDNLVSTANARLEQLRGGSSEPVSQDAQPTGENLENGSVNRRFDAEKNKSWLSRLKDIIVRKLKSLAELPSRAKKALYRKIEDYAMKKVFEKSPEKIKQEEQTNTTINRIQDINNEIARLQRLRENPIDDEDANSLDAAIKKANKNRWDVVRENARLRR